MVGQGSIIRRGVQIPFNPRFGSSKKIKKRSKTLRRRKSLKRHRKVKRSKKIKFKHT